MAELDDKLLKNLDKTLQSMNQRLQGLEQTLAGVKEGMVSAFNPAIIKSFTDSMRGLKAIRLIEADEAVKDIKKIEDEIDSLESKYKGEKPLKKGESLGSVREELSRYKALMREIDKGSEQRAIELANIRQKERDADLKAAEVVVSQREQAERRKAEIARAWAEQEAREKAQREKMKTASEKAAADERTAIAEAEAKKKSEIAKAWAQHDKQQAFSSTDINKLGDLAATRGLTGVSQEIKQAEKEAEEAAKRTISVFDRVLIDINKKAETQKGLFAKRIFDAEETAKAEKEFVLAWARTLSKAKSQATPQSFLTEFGRENVVNQLLLYGNQGKLAKNSLIEYQAAQKKLLQLQEQLEQGQRKYAANASAIEGVTRRYNDNEQALAKLQQRWEELNVKKQAGLINQKDFDAQTQKILDQYDRLIAKRKEFYIGDLGQMSSARIDKAEQERLEAERKNAQDRLKVQRDFERERSQLVKKTDSESLANQRRQIEIKSRMAVLDKNRAAQSSATSAKEKAQIASEIAEYKSLSQELTKLIARQKELDRIAKGSGNRARQKLETYEITQSEKALRQYEQTWLRLKNTQQQTTKGLQDMLPTLQRLASAFGVAFSVRGLAQFGKKLIETRGEFERQQVALRSILQNKQLADEIWDKTMQAALQSPFTAMQLTTYTKQLAAYRIETDKLFETTKRLADVSAGLGVDMQRLILAYGQVKAANYLRASEIRQFTEAGVNVLGELRDYFNDVKGMSVDTAQVMEMVTKRLVTFEDVEAIFKRMTDQGGIFYEMQYVQSQTVRGQIAKLHDAYDQMLNSIGQANEGVLKNMVSLLNNIVKNWQEFKTVIDLIAWPLLISFVYKFSRGLMTTATASRLASEGMSKVVIAGAKAKEMFTKLFATIATHPFIALGAAVAAVGVALLNHAKHVRDINKRYEDLMLRTYETQKNLNGLSETIQNNLDTMKKATKGSEEYNEASRENENIVKKLKDQYPELLQGIDLQKDGYEKLIEKIKEYNDELENQIRLEYAARAGFWQDDLTTNIADLQEAQRKREMQFLQNRNLAETEYLKNGKKDNDIWWERIRLAKTWAEQVEIIKEQNKTGATSLQSYGFVVPGAGGLFGGSVETNLANLSNNIKQEALVFNDIIRDQLETINEDLGDDIQQFIKDNETQVNELFKDKEGAGWKLLNKQITKFFTAKGATDKETREAIQNFLNEYLLIPIQLDWGGSETTETATKELADWQKRVNEAIDKASSDFNKKRAKLSEDAKKNMPEIEVYKIKDPLKTLEDAQSEILKKLKEVRAKIASYEVKGQVAIDNAEYQALKLTEQELEQVRILLGAVAKVTGGGGHTENASKLISLIKEMRGEYDKLSKSAYGYAKSEEKVRDAYRDSVKAILEKAGVTEGYDFTTNEGMIAALDKVLAYANKLGPEAAAEVQKYIDQLETEIEINAQVRIREDFGKQMEKAFNDYELTLELDKLNLPKGLAADMWGIEETDLQDLRKKLSQMYMGLRDENGQLSDEAFKDYEKFLNKIDDLERKQQKERLKDYSKYLEAQYSERVKIEMDYVRKLAALEAETAIKEPQKREIREGLKREFLEKSRKQDWEDFKGSEFYVGMMEDLEKQGSASLEVMREKLLEMRENAENLSPRALKEVVNALEKIDELEKKRIQPLKRIREEQEKLKGIEIKDVYERIAANQEKLAQDEQEQKDLERMIMLEEERQKLEKQGITLEEAKARLARSEQALSLILPSLDTRSDGTKEGEERRRILTETVNQAKKEVENWAEIVRILSGQAVIDEQERGSKYGGLSLSDLKKRRDDAKQRIKDLEGLIGKDEELVKAQKDLEDAWNDTLEAAKRWAQSINGIFDGVMDTVGYFSDSTSTLTDGWKEFGDTSISALTDLVSGIQAYQQANAAAKKAGLATGLFTANGLQLAMVVLSVIIKIVQAIAKLHDARIDKEIEQSKERVDDLQKAYDRLEKSIEKTFDTVSYIREYNQEVQNLNEQIEEANRQIAAAQDYKNAEKKKEAIEAAEDAKQEALDALEEIKQAQIEVFGGIGRDSYRSAAEGFVDAWKSAFLETGDGLQGLQDHFDEFLNDWFVKQATMRYAAAALEPVFKMIDDAVDPYGAGGANVVMQELEAIKEWARVNFPQISDTLEEISRPFIGEGEGSLSGLAAGIQGMTEEQANILEAYWNSVRGYTANIDMNVSRIAQILGAGGDSTNPQLQQLSLIAANTQATHQLLQSVTKSGHSQGGYGIKVFAD